MPIEGLNFDEVMAAQNGVPEEKAEATGLTKVRYFTKEGIEQVEQLLKKIRTDKEMYKDEVDELVNDPEYAKEMPGGYKIDRERKFETKKDLCEYFVPLFGSEFLEVNRKNVGLWTWLALAYYNQFVKTVKGAVKLTSNARWIFSPNNFQDGRRHYIAGNIYLYLDIKEAGVAAINMFLTAGPVTQFNTITDIMTHVQVGMQSPAVMRVAAELYYDPKMATCIKRGATSGNKPGSARQLTRVIPQFSETWDFYNVDTAADLWNKLPSQFDLFKSK